LGGFPGLKIDRDGAKTIWIGKQRIVDAALAIQALRVEES
jgi:hypothetical protein